MAISLPDPLSLKQENTRDNLKTAGQPECVYILSLVSLASRPFVSPKATNGKRLVRGLPLIPREKGVILMSEFICFLIGLSIGGLFGVTTMCLMQINRMNHTARRKEDSYEEEKC